MDISERRFTITFDQHGKPARVDGPTCPEYEQHGGFPTAVEVVCATDTVRGAVSGSFTIRWDASFGAHGGYRVSIPNLDPDGEGVEVVPVSHLRGAVDPLREVLAFYADKDNYVPAGIAPTIWKDNGARAREALNTAGKR